MSSSNNSNKFYHKPALKQAATKAAKDREDLETYMKESFEGVYKTLTELSEKLDTRFRSINQYGEDVASAINSIQQEIIDLNEYVKKNTLRTAKLEARAKLRDALGVGLSVVVFCLVAAEILAWLN